MTAGRSALARRMEAETARTLEYLQRRAEARWGLGWRGLERLDRDDAVAATALEEILEAEEAERAGALARLVAAVVKGRK